MDCVEYIEGYRYVSMGLSDKEIVAIAGALSDKTRMRILREISGRESMTCGETEKVAHLSQPTISHHLKILFKAGLLKTRKSGRHVNLTLNSTLLDDFGRYFSLSSRKRGGNRRRSVGARRKSK
ncbi:MAG TPA: helix-turn-helix domain-containing protein [Bacteroidota bacterium]|nr:helix-turn-helix domain-containing protein [Bacteroidota bacterium]